ncbi:MAG TPA: hypothetical protein VOA41_10225 [Candidatus Dormibacteraeota bacterium]|nr:hypothetical protein [Candidatus Dormibacteraeota bacterium]
MGAWSPIALVFGAVILFTIGAITWSLVKKRKREDGMARTAVTIGFALDGDAPGFLQEGIADVPLFSLNGLDRFEITSLMRGRVGTESVAICDYHYWTGSAARDTRFDYSQTVFCFECAPGRLPDFTLAARMSAAKRGMVNLGARVNKIPLAIFKPLVGRARAELFETIVSSVDDPGVEFAEHPNFSACYRLQATDAGAARAAFSAGAIQSLESQPQSFSIQKVGRWLVLYQHNVLVRAEELGNILHQAASISALFRHDR